MRIVITDTAHIWNHANAELEKYKDNVLVVCLNGKKITDKYECFVSPYKQVCMGTDSFGTETMRYKALKSVAGELNNRLYWWDSVLFLTDNNPESLYPFHVVKDLNEYNDYICSLWHLFDLKREDVLQLINNSCRIYQNSSLSCILIPLNT